VSSLPAVEKQEPSLKQGRTSIAGIGIEIANPNSPRAPKVAGAECLGVADRVKGEQGLTTASIAAAAARSAIKDAGLSSKGIEQIVVGTTSPDVLWPSTACLVQTELGIGMVPAFDLYAGDASGLTALSVADRLVRAGSGPTLVIAADSDNQLVDLPGQSAKAMSTRTTGAAAVVLGRAGGRGEVLATVSGGSARPKSSAPDNDLVAELTTSTTACLNRANISSENIGLVIYDPGQRDLIQRWAKASGLEEDRLLAQPTEQSKGGSVSILATLARLLGTSSHSDRPVLLISTTAGPAWAIACVKLQPDASKAR